MATTLVPQFFDDLLIDVTAIPLSARIQKALQGHDGGISQPSADPLEGTFLTLKGVQHALETLLPDGIALNWFIHASGPRPLPLGGKRDYNTQDLTQLVPDTEGVLVPTRHSAYSDAADDIPVLVIVAAAASSVFRSYIDMMHAGLNVHFRPGPDHRDHNTVVYLFTMSSLRERRNKTRLYVWPADERTVPVEEARLSSCTPTSNNHRPAFQSVSVPYRFQRSVLFVCRHRCP